MKYILVFLFLWNFSILSNECKENPFPILKKDHNGWMSIIHRTMKNLVEYSNFPYSSVQVYIFDSSCFNAVSNKNGIYVHSYTLDILDNHSKEILKNPSKDFRCEEEIVCREKLIAPILAHELSHILNGDIYELDNLKMKGVSSSEIKKKHYAMEEKADEFANFLLKRSGYENQGMIEVLEIVKKIEQLSNQKEENRKDPYLREHPSPNKRLAKIVSNTKSKSYYEWTSKLEISFADIRRGINLSLHLNQLNSSLKKFPNNVELLTAKAICLHKIWIQSASVSELQLKSVIDLPLFSDNQIFEKFSKGGTKIGDSKKYETAIQAYKTLLNKTNDIRIRSNYGVLLVYSEYNDDRYKGLELTEAAYKESPMLGDLSFHTLNNLVVAKYLNGDQLVPWNILGYMGLKLGIETISNVYSPKKDPSEHGLYSEYTNKLEFSKQPDSDIRLITLLNYCIISRNPKLCKNNEQFQTYYTESEWMKLLDNIHN